MKARCISGVFQDLQRDYKVVMTGPSTLTAFLNSLQMGFKTLAISKQSAEVWKVLGAVKTEVGKFEDALSSVQRNLETATNNLGKVSTKARQMGRKLKDVEALPFGEAEKCLPEIQSGDAEADDRPFPGRFF
jgi:DNA recombination protein RmuC